MIENTFSARNTDINYVQAPGPNDVPPLVMVHGVTRRWQTFLPLFASLSIRRPVFALDHRGHGRSSRTPGAYRVAEYTPDLVDFVGQFSQPVLLYGHSLGAMVVAQAAAELGDQVAGVVMEDPPLHAMGERIRESSLLSHFQAMHAGALSRKPVAAVAQQLADSMIRDPRTGLEVRLGSQRDMGSLRFSASCLRNVDPEVFEPILGGRWLDGYDVEGIFARLKQPSLLLQANPDAGGMLSDTDAETVAELATDLTRVRLDCSHNINWDRTSQLLNYVHVFFESLDL